MPGYQIGPVIGVGGFCKVRLGTDLATGKHVALKVIEKNHMQQVSRHVAHFCHLTVPFLHTAFVMAP